MQSSGHSAAPRPGGGFNAGMGQFGEHLDEAAMMKAMQTKGQHQQQASASNVPTPPSAQQKTAPPREMGSLVEELFQRPFQDFIGGLKSLGDLDMWLGIEPTPEQEQERARKEIILKRFNQLNDEQQAIAKQRCQEDLQRKQAEEEEKERRKQQEAQAQQQSLNIPHKAANGPVGPASAKQKASTQLQSDRLQGMDKGSKVG